MRRGALALAVLLAAALPGGAAPEDGPGDPGPYEPSPTSPQERRLVQGLLDARRGRLDDALAHMDALVRQQPDFQLAQLVRGDLLLALTGRLGRFAAGAPDAVAHDYREEARARLGRYLQSPPPATLPSELLRLPSTAAAAIVIDLERYRLYLLENRSGVPSRTSDFYVSIGKGGIDKWREGDEKTPVGVYLVTSFIPGSRLPDLYGVGAFPISYPNGWDRMLGRTGSGIWIHGTQSDSYSRPPLSSRGCVTLSNSDFHRLETSVELGRTPVVVSQRLEWVDAETQRRRGERLLGAIESWRRDWESLDTDRLLAHYSRRFRTQGMDRARFAAHKRRVNAGKRRIRVEVSELGLYGYPGETDLVVAHFRQRYESDDFSASTRKHQYWRLEEGRWRIVFEERI